MRHCRAPGVQHRGDADAGAEMLGVGSDCHHRLGRRLEHDVVDRCLVLIGEVGDWPRQREHDVEVGNRQQLGLAFGHPLLCRRALALGAVPVATGIVGDDGIGAVLAARDVPAQHRRAAALDRCHDLELPKLTWPALACRHAAPWSRKISATSSAGRNMRAGCQRGV